MGGFADVASQSAKKIKKSTWGPHVSCTFFFFSFLPLLFSFLSSLFSSSVREAGGGRQTSAAGGRRGASGPMRARQPGRSGRGGTLVKMSTKMMRGRYGKYQPYGFITLQVLDDDPKYSLLIFCTTCNLCDFVVTFHVQVACFTTEQVQIKICSGTEKNDPLF